MTDMAVVSSTGKMYAAAANGYTNRFYVSRGGRSSWGMKATILPRTGGVFTRVALDPQNSNVSFALDGGFLPTTLIDRWTVAKTGFAHT